MLLFIEYFSLTLIYIFKMKKILNIILFLSIFISCSDDSSIKYESQKGYSFHYSSNNWDVEKNPDITLLVNKADKNPSFKSNINIVVQDLAGQPISLEDYHLLTLNQMEQALGRNTVESDKEVKISGSPAKEIVYTMPQNVNKADASDLKLKQVYLIKNNKAYLITYTAKMDDFATFLNSANEVFETFKVE